MLAAGASREAGAVLTGSLAAALRDALRDMRSYALKREALRPALLTSEESGAHSDALRLLAGLPVLAQPWDAD